MSTTTQPMQTPARRPSTADQVATGINDARNIGRREGYRQGYVAAFRYGVVCGITAAALVIAVGSLGLVLWQAA